MSGAALGAPLLPKPWVGHSRRDGVGQRGDDAMGQQTPGPRHREEVKRDQGSFSGQFPIKVFLYSSRKLDLVMSVLPVTSFVSVDEE